MGLLSFLKRRSADQPKTASSKPSKEVVDAVQQARTRARQRLIGAAVLVAAGVIGFPLLFATQPRPLPVDTPIEMARRDGTAATGATPRATAPATTPNVIVNETAADAGRDITPVSPAPPEPEASKPAARHEPKPADKPAEPPAERSPPKHTERERKPADKPEKPEKPAADKPATKPAKPADDARAQALLNGQDTSRRNDKPAAEADGRFIVQVGAFSEMGAAREARQKVEKLGLKTYTQVVETSAGNRVRVRVGPFASRAEADRAAGKIKSAGLGAAVFTL